MLVFVIFLALMTIITFIMVSQKNNAWTLPLSIIAFIGDLVVWKSTLAAMIVFIAIFCLITVTSLFLMKRRRADSFRRLSTMAMVLSTAFFIIFFIIFIASGIKPTSTDSATTSSDNTSSAVVNNTENSEWTLQQCTNFLAKNGWKVGDYTYSVDPAKDKSKSGKDPFHDQPIKSADQMVDFLKSTKDSAKTTISDMNSSGYATNDILNPANWVAVQSLVTFTYPSNTFYRDGKVISAGPRKGDAGDIFMVFILPLTSSTSTTESSATSQAPYSIRGGCANPQRVAPQPKDPKQDPAVKGNAPIGGGKNQDPGPGTYVPPESMVAPPSSSRVNPKPPTASSSSTASSASSVSSSSTSSSSSSIPPPELGAPDEDNPANSRVSPPGR